MERLENSIVLVKIEGTYGTDPVPTQSANAIPILRGDIQPANPRQHTQRRRATGRLSKEIGNTAQNHRTIRLSYELRGQSSISVSAPVEIDALLRSCDMTATYVTTSTPRYTPANPSTGIGDSCTIYYYSGGRLQKLTGCKGTFQIRIQPDRPAVITFTMTGLYVAVSSASLPSSPVYNDTTVPILATCVGTEGWSGLATDSVIYSAELDLGNQVVMRPSLNGTNGIAGFVVASRNPTARVEHETHPSHDPDALSRSNALVGLLATVGSAGGNTVKIGVNGSISNSAQGNQQGILTQQVDLDVALDVLTSGDSDLDPYAELYLSFE